MKEESAGHFLDGFGIFGQSRIQPRSFKAKILLLQDFDFRFAQTTVLRSYHTYCISFMEFVSCCGLSMPSWDYVQNRSILIEKQKSKACGRSASAKSIQARGLSADAHNVARG